MIATRFVQNKAFLSSTRILYSRFSTCTTLHNTTLATPPQSDPTTNQAPTCIQQDDLFHRVDLRVGTILGAELHPEAEHLYVEKVDVGEPEIRTIVSGLAKYMPKEALKDKRVVVVANLKPSRFRGVLSQGMLLAASSQSTVDLLSVPDDSVNGERVHLQDLDVLSTPDTVLKPKQKVFEQVAQHLLTNKDGVATYKDRFLVTKAGPVTSNKVKLGQIS